MDQEIVKYLEKQTGRDSDLFKFMSQEVPTSNDPNSIDKAKKIAAHADALSVTVSDWARRLAIYKDSREQEVTDEFRKYCNDNDIKFTATGLEAYLRVGLSKERRWLDYLERLQQQLRDKVILVNSLLKNTSIEDRTMATNRNIDKF